MMKTKLKHLYLAVVALACAGSASAAAQDNGDAVRASIAQIRQAAAQLKDTLTAEEISEMLQAADDLEKAHAEGRFDAPVQQPDSHPIVPHMETQHGSRYDWLIRETACAGFQWENWRSFELKVGDRNAERNRLCKQAYALYEEYFYLARDMAPGALDKLAAFDRAAHSAVDFYQSK